VLCVTLLVAWHPVSLNFFIAIYRRTIDLYKMELMLEKEDTEEIRIGFGYFVENCFCNQLYWSVIGHTNTLYHMLRYDHRFLICPVSRIR
jgi:hypothetical protein